MREEVLEDVREEVLEADLDLVRVRVELGDTAPEGVSLEVGLSLSVDVAEGVWLSLSVDVAEAVSEAEADCVLVLVRLADFVLVRLAVREEEGEGISGVSDAVSEAVLELVLLAVLDAEAEAGRDLEAVRLAVRVRVCEGTRLLDAEADG